MRSQQGAASNNGTLATPIAVAANPITPAPAMQAQILASEFLGSSQSILTDRALSSDREPDAGGTQRRIRDTLKNSATGAAGIAARSQMNSRAATGNPVTATPGGPEDGEAGGVSAIGIGRCRGGRREATDWIAAHDGTLAEATQQEPAASQHRTGSGSPQVEAAQTSAQRTAERIRIRIQEPKETTRLPSNLRPRPRLPRRPIWKAADSPRRRLRRRRRIGTVPARRLNRQRTLVLAAASRRRRGGIGHGARSSWR